METLANHMTSALGRPVRIFSVVALFILHLAAWPTAPAGAAELKVMITGLGTGVVASSPAGISCGTACDFNFPASQSVTLAAAPGPGSAFDGWDTDQDADPTTIPDCAGTALICTVSMNVARSVRPRFRLTVPITQITDFTPGGINAYLTANPAVDTPAEFIAALPPTFRENWILMTRSESLQTGTAQFPRVLLFNGDVTAVFTVGMAEHSSYPGSHPNAIEYMQWDAADKNFRLHEIVLAPIGQMGNVSPRTRQLRVDDPKCSRCHSTQNVLNTTSLPGTDGIPPGTVKVKNKPNWDAYDSWGGMLPFNRDRIYNGSVEAAAVRKIFNPWTWRAQPQIRTLIEQLKLQPQVGASPDFMMWRMRGGANDGQIRFRFDGNAPPGVTQRENPPQFGAGTINTNYSFDGAPGTGSTTVVSQEGDLIQLQQSPVISPPDEGRGVQLFDRLGGFDGQLNAIRIADELVGHRFATGSVPIDVRPIALAVLDQCITTANIGNLSSNGTLTVPLNFFSSRHGMTLPDLIGDTFERARDLPRRKADLQRRNFDRNGDPYLLSNSAVANGLIRQYLPNIPDPADIGIARIRKEVFRRSGGNDQTVMGGIYVDRESHPLNSDIVGIARFFLEPLGVSVDKWSFNVRGRSRSYNFADVLPNNINVITPILRASLAINSSVGDANYCPTVIGLVNSSLAAGKLPGSGDQPTYTDIQRIFNKGCIECHGGLGYPPYANFGSSLDLSENDAATGAPDDRRMSRSYRAASSRAASLNGPLFRRVTNLTEICDDNGGGMMPFCGPPLSNTDIETLRRWIVGTTPYSEGDPHIVTVDDVHYDFQGAGEYVLLRDENTELQARHTPVSTAGPLGPNGYTGLTSCVSVNSAVALRLGSDRITYQPNINGEPDPSGLKLRINGKQVELGFKELLLPSGGRILSTTLERGLSFQSQGGFTVTVSPVWWETQQVWYMNINVRQARATDGLMGAIAPGNWLPALPDTGQLGDMPADLQNRYDQLYLKFGNSWRVDKNTSLFDYASHLGPGAFVDEKWPMGESPKSCGAPALAGGQKPQPPGKSIDKETAMKICNGIEDKARLQNCIQDVSVTGEASFAELYRNSDRTLRTVNARREAPTLVFPADLQKGVAPATNFEFKNSVESADTISRTRFCIWREDQEFGFNFCRKEPVKSDNIYFPQLEKGKAYFWKVIVDDDAGGFVESETRQLTVQ